MRSIHYFVIFFLLSIIISCKVIEGDQTNYAYIGGEIINPKNNDVVLYNTQREVVDSISLDEDNRFIYKIENLKPGLYTITHGGEYQMVILEPQDSIMFRLNTYDFDESLVFTGNGAKRNNYLIKTYLTNEQDQMQLIKHTKLEPEAFNEYIESHREKQLNEFYEFLEHNDESEFFKSVIEDNINYNAYANKEIYPFAYFGNNKLIHIKDLPEDFYAYRKDIDYNARHLSHFYTYNRFLFSHIDNLATHSYYKKNNFHSAFDRHSMSYNKSKLDLIDSIIEDETIKNELLKYKTADYISHNHTEAEANEMLDYYVEKSSNKNDIKAMTELVASLKLLRQGNPLPNLAVVNFDETEHNLPNIITKPTIIHFWSSNSKMQYRNSHYKVRDLKSRFKNVDFVSINLNRNDSASWKEIIENYDFPKTYEYRFKDPEEAKRTLAINYLNKAIIVNKNGIILHPNVNIYKPDFSETLDKLLQKKHLIVQK